MAGCMAGARGAALPAGRGSRKPAAWGPRVPGAEPTARAPHSHAVRGGLSAGSLPGARPFHSAAAPSSLATVMHVPSRPLRWVAQQGAACCAGTEGQCPDGHIGCSQTGSPQGIIGRQTGELAPCGAHSPVLGCCALGLQLELHLCRVCGMLGSTPALSKAGMLPGTPEAAISTDQIRRSASTPDSDG